MTFESGGYFTDTEVAQLLALQDDWLPYTPAWTSTSTTPTLGNGTIAGAYALGGKLIIAQVRLDWGSTTSGGAGSWKFGLPSGVGAVMAATGRNIGSVLMRDNSAATHFMGAANADSTTTFEVRCSGANVAGGTTPFIWAISDFVAATILAELA